MIHTSEWVSPAHPDKMADFISEYLLDRFLERDPNTRYAVEVMIKDNMVTLGGEVTSGADFDDDELADFVREAVERIGYTHAYAEEWGGRCTDASLIDVRPLIGLQSPDIAQGVDSGGWGDQGIFWGMAVPYGRTSYMPMDVFLAREIGMALYRKRIGGIDIKTMVSCDDADGGRVKRVVVAIPFLPERAKDGAEVVESIVDGICGEFTGRGADSVVVNGTGSYVTHGSVGDCGITGRKLAVDFYGGNCPIGGGSPWTKDGTKADLALNLYARKRAVEYAGDYNRGVKVSISCAIGSDEVEMQYCGVDGVDLFHKVFCLPPERLIELYGLRKPVFASMCMNGLMYY